MAILPLVLAIPRFKGNEERIDLFTNGTALQTWMTSEGIVLPTLAKFLADNQAQIDTIGAKSVRVDIPQTFTDPEKEQARDNIGLGSAAVADASDFATNEQGEKADNAVPVGASAPVVLTDWEPDYSFRRYVTDAQWDGILSGISTEILSVEMQEAEEDVHNKGGGIIRYPAGQIAIDGYKGAESSFNVSKKGGLYILGGVHHKGVFGKTIFKNVVADWRCLVSIREGSNWSMEDIILDGNRYNFANTLLASDSVRGEGIIFWNQVAPVSNITLKGVEVRNVGHYGIGVQNVTVSDLNILQCIGYDCGGDFIDIKDYPTEPKTNIKIIGNTARRIGTNWQERVAEGAGPQAGYDIRGACLVAQNTLFELDSYDPTQLGNDGFRVNADVDSNNNRKGGAKSILTGNRVISSKLLAEGSDTVKRIRGLVLNDERAIVRGHYNLNCYIGTIIANAGDSDVNYCDVSGVTNDTCRGALAGSGIGTQIGSGTIGHTVQVTNLNCGIGFSANCTASGGEISNYGCTLGNDMNVAALSLNNFKFKKGNNTSNANVNNALNNFSESLTVWGLNGGYLFCRSTFDGNWTAPYSAGGLIIEKEDVSGDGAGQFGKFELRGNAAAGAASLWVATVDDGSGAVDVLTIGYDFIKPLKPLVLPTGNVPATATSTGTAGQMAYDTGFIYICTATNTWKRVAIASW